MQFMLIGLFIFAVDAIAQHYRQDDSVIVIDDAQLSELIEIFTLGQGRSPTPTEIDNLIVKWTQNEVMYREAKKMGLDQGDEMIRNRLVLKMQNVLFNSVTIEVPPDEELKTWFEEYRNNYDTPARYSVEQFYFSPFSQDQLQQAQSLASKITDGQPPETFQGKVRVYPNRPAGSLSGMFAAGEVESLIEAPINHWQTVKSDKGLHLARIVSKQEPQLANFEDIKNQVIKDWKQYSNDVQMMQQTTDIASRYTIHITAQKTDDSAKTQSQTAGK